ncbi:unnamed protein product, partial [marine sediment metagenome]
MTKKEFVDKWAYKISYIAIDIHFLYWYASYHENDSFIPEMTADFLSTNPFEGVSLRRAIRLKTSFKEKPNNTSDKAQRQEAFVKTFWEDPDTKLLKIVSGIYGQECLKFERLSKIVALRDRPIGYQHRVITMAIQQWETYVE